MDSFDVYAVVSELQQMVGGWVGKVYQRRNELIIKVRKDGNKNLFIKNGKWLFLSSRMRAGEGHPPAFAMTLRKYINNKKIDSISQNGFDRIVTITFSNSYRLAIELFSDGNIILIDDKGKIVIPMRFQSWSHREIRPRREYVPPPERTNPFGMDFQSFFDMMTKSDKDVIRTMVMDVNIPGIWGEEICRISGIDKNIMPEKMGGDDIKKLYEGMQSVLSRFRKKEFEPVVVMSTEGGEYVDVLPFPLGVYGDARVIKFGSFNEALDDFFSNAFSDETEKASLGERDKLIRRMEQQEEAIKKFELDAEKKRDEGDAIYSSYKLCEEVIEAVKKGEDAGGRVKSYTYPNVILDIPYGGRNLEISLDVRKSVSQNADAKYKAGKKAMEKIEGARAAMNKTARKLEELKSEPEVTEDREKKPVKRLWFENYRWFISSDGNLVIGGKDASSNEKIVKKYLKAGDRYIHADVHGAPSCVVKAADAEGNELPISEKTLEEACQFALSYSKAWNQFAGGSAYWVNPEQVSKTPESGEYLPRGAFVIRGKRNYVKCDIEIAIGKVEIQGYEKIMGGAPSAVKKWAGQWVVIEHGETNKNEGAKYLAKKFGAGVEEMQRVLPPGGVRIKEEHI